MHNQLPMPDEPSIAPVLRYPGGKQRILKFLSAYLPPAGSIGGRYIEPFVGGASVFLHVGPHRAILSDSNAELIDLYRGIKLEPLSVWRTYASFLDTKEEYIRVRRINPRWLNLAERTARLLYLNRTCFKGNWAAQFERSLQHRLWRPVPPLGYQPRVSLVRIQSPSIY